MEGRIDQTLENHLENSTPRGASIVAALVIAFGTQIAVQTIPNIPLAEASESDQSVYENFPTLTVGNLDSFLEQNRGKRVLIMFSGPACHPCLELAESMLKIKGQYNHVFGIVHALEHDEETDEYIDNEQLVLEKLKLKRDPKGGTPSVLALRYDPGAKEWQPTLLKSQGKYDKKNPTEHWMRPIRGVLGARAH